MAMTIKLVDFFPNKIASRFTNNDEIGTFAAETVARHMSPYVPMDTGMLYSNFTTRPWQITYESNYAKHCFFGTGINFRKDKHPNATARWDKATESAKSIQIAREITNYIKRM